ncbi:MAG TPA: A/G-specific adenine glycosylase, partial [Candidatus Synoicihabitans sp.]|nr:A/G-specific adenine glycosylase [Candidatus Synoicihabitans sp.]
ARRALRRRMPRMSWLAATSLVTERAAFQVALLQWYRAHRRQLPWREAPSLYKTVVSEFMLQQTQVKTVLPYFARWMAALPDFATLAAADEAQVLKLWEGLGYYTRARNLHRLARTIVALPEVPRTPEAWLELPGIGPYSAAAITSIAFGAPAACVDGNVVRILARLTADGTAYHDGVAAARTLAPLADALLTRDQPGDHNQAMMELGATICVRRNPLCTICPVRPHCVAGTRGDAESFPQLAAKVIERQAIARIWCERDGALLLHRASADARRLANLHELPTAADVAVNADALANARVLATRKRGITRFAITETIYELTPPVPLHGEHLVWVPIAQLDSVTLSGPHRRWVNELLRGR